MKKPQKKRHVEQAKDNKRWLLGAVVGVAVLAILGYKLVAARNVTSLPLPTEMLAPVTATLAREFTVNTPPPTPSAQATATLTGAVTQDEPFPSSPGEQVDWALRHGKPAIVVFHSTNCIPCKVMEQLVKKVRTDYEPQVVFVDVITNDRANLALIQAAQIRAIPTTFFFTKSGKAKRVVGAMKEEALRAELTNLLVAE